MIYTKHIEHKINVRPYETITIGASIEWDDHDYVDDPEIGENPDLVLQRLLEKDLQQAQDLAHEDSYIHEWQIG